MGPGSSLHAVVNGGLRLLRHGFSLSLFEYRNQILLEQVSVCVTVPLFVTVDPRAYDLRFVFGPRFFSF